MAHGSMLLVAGQHARPGNLLEKTKALWPHGRIASTDFVGVAQQLFEQFTQPELPGLVSNVGLLLFRATPKDAAKVATAAMASFVDPDEFRDCGIGARYDR